jgi:hypothetical protein
VGEDVGGRRRIGDEAGHIGIDVAIGAVEAGALDMPGNQRAMQKIDTTGCMSALQRGRRDTSFIARFKLSATIAWWSLRR